jgi:hypothetical protein
LKRGLEDGGERPAPGNNEENGDDAKADGPNGDGCMGDGDMNEENADGDGGADG